MQKAADRLEEYAHRAAELLRTRDELELGAIHAALTDLSVLTEDARAATIDQLRYQGATWQYIGGSLLTSRQAAQQRYGRPDDSAE